MSKRFMIQKENAVKKKKKSKINFITIFYHDQLTARSVKNNQRKKR